MEDNTFKIDLSANKEETPQVEAQTTQETTQEAPVEEPKKEIPTNEDGDYVINLNQPEDAVQESEAEEVPVQSETGSSEEVVEEDNSPVLELVEEETPQVDEEVKVVNEETPIEKVNPEDETGTIIKDPVPEGIQSFIDFMNDTGLDGTKAMEAYVNLNKNPEEMDARTLLTEYYKATKPFMNDTQIQTQLNKKYAYEEGSIEPEEAEERNLALQEELYHAKQHFTNYKEKYYSDLKLRQQHSLPPEAQEAVQHYSTYKQQQENLAQTSTVIQKQIDQVFNEEFKGFDFKVGESKYRFKVADTSKTKETHKSFDKVFGNYFQEDGTLKDAVGYNKALFAAQNADKLAQHFYEQGRADAVQESAKKSKNIDMEARQDNTAVTTPSGQTVRVISGNSKSSFKPKMRIPGWNN